MSIKSKLVLIFLGVALIPLLFFSAVTFRHYRDSLEAVSLSGLENIADYKVELIEKYFDWLRSNIEIAGELNPVKYNFPVLNRLAAEPLNPEFIAAKEAIDERLRRIQITLGLDDIMLVNPEGRIVYSSDPRHQAKDFSNNLPDFGQKAFEAGKTGVHLSDIFFDKLEENRPAALLTAPVLAANNAFIGIIAFECDMTPLYKIIQDAKGLGNTGETLIGKKTAGEVLYLNPLRHDPLAALRRRVRLGDKTGVPIQRAAQGQTGSGLSIDYRNKEVIAAWRPVPSQGWGLVTKIDAAEAFAPITHLKRLILILLVILIALVVAVAFSVIQSITEPVRRLTKGVEIVGSGNLDYKVGTDLRDEIGRLSRAFDKMTRDLKAITASRDELNKEIDRRRQAEEQIRRGRRQLERSQEIAHLGSWELDLSNNRLSWSDEAYRIFGLEPQEFKATYEAFLEAIHPEDRRAVDEAYSGSLRDGKDFYEIEHRIVRKKTGEIRVVHEKCEHLRDGSGRMIRSVGMVHDITERKRAEEQVRESQERVRLKLKSLLEPEGDIGKLELADIIDVATLQALMDDFFKIIRIPMAIIDLKGTALVGVGWQKICTQFHRTHAETCRNCIESDTRLSEDTRPGEFKLYKCKNNMWDIATPLMIGGKKFGNLFMGQFFFEGETPDYAFFRAQAKRYGFDEKEYLAALNDVPRLTKESMETGMRFLVKFSHVISDLSYGNIKLARLFSERDTLAKSLGRREIELRRSNESLEEFAYVASHDLQEPLRKMASYSELMEKRYKARLDADADEFIGYIVDGAKRMQRLIHDLLEYSRIGRAESPPEEIDCNLILKKVLGAMSHLIEENHAVVTQDALPLLAGDETHFSQLFQNLIGNAIKFRGVEPPRVHVGAVRQQGEWLFSVKDNGIGVEPQYRERIFQIFQRLHPRNKYPGTGIGLSICKKIVEAHGGRIWVESEPDQGAAFYFTVPVTAVPLPVG